MPHDAHCISVLRSQLQASRKKDYTEGTLWPEYSLFCRRSNLDPKFVSGHLGPSDTSGLVRTKGASLAQWAHHPRAPLAVRLDEHKTPRRYICGQYHCPTV